MLKRWVVPTLILIIGCLAFTAANCDHLVSAPNEDTVTQDWVSRYDGGVEDDDGGQALSIDGVGNIYVTGYSWGAGSSIDYATMKYDSTGNRLWIERYNGPANGDDWALDLAPDSSGNVYVTGWSQGNGTNTDCATIKYDSDGNQVWVTRYDGMVRGYDEAHAVAVDYANNVYITGWSQGYSTEADFITIKYDSDGNELWVARYNGPVDREDKSYAIAVDTWANVYITGSSQGNNTWADYTTIKYDSDGNQIWVARYNGKASGEDQAQSVAVDNWGNVFVTGFSEGNTSGFDYSTIKYNNYGEQIWVARYNGPANGEDKACDMTVDTRGNIFVTGWSLGIGTDMDYATVKYDCDGNEMWVARYNGPDNAEDVARVIDLDGYGNPYVSGWSRGINVRYDFATLKYDTDGNQMWAIRYNGPAKGHDKVYGMAVDGIGNVYVTGRSSGETTYYDYTTIKYSQH